MQTSLFQEIEEFTKCSNWIENQDSAGSSNNDLFLFVIITNITINSISTESKLLFSTETNSSSDEQFEAFSAIFNQAFEKCSNENDNTQNQFNISLQTIANDKRTTLMIRNIPNNYTMKRLQNEIDFKFYSKYDQILKFYYLLLRIIQNYLQYINLIIYDYINIPCDLEGGFAFINLKNKKYLQEFYLAFNNRPWNFNKKYSCVLKYAKVQYNENQLKYQKKIDPDIYSHQKNVIDLIKNQKKELKQ